MLVLVTSSVPNALARKSRQHVHGSTRPAYSIRNRAAAIVPPSSVRIDALRRWRGDDGKEWGDGLGAMAGEARHERVRGASTAKERQNHLKTTANAHQKCVTRH